MILIDGDSIAYLRSLTPQSCRPKKAKPTNWDNYYKVRCSDGKVRHHNCPYTKAERMAWARRQGYLRKR